MPPMNHRATFLLALAAAALLTPAACHHAGARRAQLASENPLDRAAAIVQVQQSNDLDALHKLVDLLDDRDAGVRMYAILALRRMCGVDFGYRYFHGDAARLAAIQRWRDALRAGEISAPSGGPPPHTASDRPQSADLTR